MDLLALEGQRELKAAEGTREHRGQRVAWESRSVIYFYKCFTFIEKRTVMIRHYPFCPCSTCICRDMMVRQGTKDNRGLQGPRSDQIMSDYLKNLGIYGDGALTG